MTRRRIFVYGGSVITAITFFFFLINEYIANQRLAQMYSYRLLNPTTEVSKYTSLKNRTNILLFIGIFSYIKFIDRRNAIRKTWMSYCGDNCMCLFMMDGRNNRGDPISKYKYNLLLNENKIYGDIAILDSFEGVNFAYRFYSSFLWASERYKFEFFLRVDDDYYICLQRLLFELPFRRKEKYLYWGYQHCVEGITRIDEGWSLFGADLIEEFIKNREGLICHKYGDQAVASWVNDLSDIRNITWFGDKRIHHSQVSKDYRSIISDTNLCSNYLSLHGCYPETMSILHNNHKNRGKSHYKISTVTDNCPYLHGEFKFNNFDKSLRCFIALCVYEPVWTFEKMFVGREKRFN